MDQGQFEAALADLARTYAVAADAASAAPDRWRAFGNATQLAAAVRELAEAASDLRAAIAADIQKDEELSLASLASRLGVSKARAAHSPGDRGDRPRAAVAGRCREPLRLAALRG